MAQGGPQELAGIREGEILAGKYRVDRILGVGGMGVVVAAHHVQLDTKVAIKFLLPDMLTNREAVARFAREARAAVKITSEHVARVFDVGRLETGAPYMVMEYLDGADLGVLLQRQGPLPFEEAADFVLQACEAIAEAHALSIVHRDLKPANLFCIRSADGRLTIKVLDFGISKVTSLAASAPSMALTQASALMGSPLYMSPEQMEASQPVDARTDIWALGVVLYELLTGKVPFNGETLPEISLKIAMRAPPPLRDFRPNAPDGLEAVILRCLEKDRQRRYRNVGELGLALLPFGPKRAKVSVEKITAIIQAAGLSATALSVPPSSEPTSQPTSAETIAPLGTTSPGMAGGKKAMLGIVAVAGVLALAGVMALAFISRNGTRSAQDTRHTTATSPPTEAEAEALPVLSPLTTSETGAAANVAIPATVSTARAPQTVAKPPRKKPTLTAGPTPTLTPQISPPPPPKPNCDPNFTFDDQGRKHFKPECFSNPPG